MVSQTRKEQLQELLASEPDDAFLLYGLAMEYRKEKAYDQARPLFEQLMARRPPYVPAFFMLGQMLAEMGEVEQARTALRSGIDTVRRDGWNVQSIWGDFHIPGDQLHLHARADDLPPCDVTIVALKTTQNRLLRELLGPPTAAGYPPGPAR
jgi:tetratricopeptide (TPR) repeat protein